jgi:hypothetical protein
MVRPDRSARSRLSTATADLRQSVPLDVAATPFTQPGVVDIGRFLHYWDNRNSVGFAVFGIHRATHGGMMTLFPSTSTAPTSATPPASGTQAPVPAPSTSPSQAPTAPAGASVTISGIKENRTIACNDSAINVSGISNQVVITGHCASLHVSGVQNSITVDAVDSIDVSGFNNQITYHTGSPTIENSGGQNVVEKG